jgi:polyphenol oxidase
MEWREEDDVRWLEASLPGATAAFSTRLGGASAGPFESLNLGILTGDEQSLVSQNRRRLATAIGREPERIVIARQVHAADVMVHPQAQHPAPYAVPGTPIPELDGHVVSEPGLAPLVFVADCLPVALAGPGGLALLHCGWRGLAGGIVGRGADAVGATDAAVGPGIGPCCYEVGEEVLRAFAGLGPGVAEGRMLDLAEVALRTLRAAGVERIELSGLCTSCNEELFFSHRRDGGTTGRQAGVAWLENGAG